MVDFGLNYKASSEGLIATCRERLVYFKTPIICVGSAMNPHCEACLHVRTLILISKVLDQDILVHVATLNCCLHALSLVLNLGGGEAACSRII